MNGSSAAGRRPEVWVVVLFLLCAAFFLQRGPYRAVRYSTTGDFSTVYAATRCWLSGANPYDRAELKTALAAAGAGEDLQHDQDINPSVYLPAALPWASAVCWMHWQAANLVWCLLSVLAFGFALSKLLDYCPVSWKAKWLIACAALLFSPTYVGVYDGNPSVLSISLSILAIVFALEQKWIVAGALLGIASCFKPQIAVCAVCVLLLWKYWAVLLIGAGTFGLALSVGVAVVSHGGQEWRWRALEQQNVAASFVPGGQSDPAPQSHVAWQLLNTQTLSAYASDGSRWTDIVVWLLMASLAAIFLWSRQRAVQRVIWFDAAFVAAVTLAVTYHRYYDAQLLLLLMPMLCLCWKGKRFRYGLLTLAMLGALAFPLQSVFERRLGPAALVESPEQFILLRFQPLAVVTLCCVLALQYRLRTRPLQTVTRSEGRGI